MNNLRGILYMILSMLLFTAADIAIKTLGAHFAPGQLFVLAGLGGTLFFGPLLLRNGEPLFDKSFFSPLILFRNFTDVAGTFCVFLSVILIPISTVSAIMQAAPLIATLAAALVLGEKVGWRRWLAISAGLFGALLIVRPGAAGFEPLTLITLLGVILQALRDVATRPASALISSARIGFYGILSLTALGLGMMITSEGLPDWPEPALWPYIVILPTVGSLGYHLLNVSIRLADVSVVVPFRYSRILFGILAGILIFSERPDRLTLIGAAIIVSSGLFVFWREQHKKRRQP